LQSSESEVQLEKRRAERALAEEKERALRLERELEGWKAMRMEKTPGGVRRGSGLWSVRGEGTGVEENGIDIPKRKSSISRQVSFSKGFL
jgi:myosin protein heavy chain